MGIADVVGHSLDTHLMVLVGRELRESCNSRDLPWGDVMGGEGDKEALSHGPDWLRSSRQGFVREVAAARPGRVIPKGYCVIRSRRLELSKRGWQMR